MDLYIVRHAWAGHAGDPEWPNDAVRPLSPKGKRRFRRMAEKLAGRGVTPDVIASSPLVRCMETAEILAKAVPGGAEVVPRDELLPGGDLNALLAWTRQMADDYGQIAWVGHAPDVGRLAAAAIGWHDGAFDLGKGAVAAIRFGNPPELGKGEMRWLVTAKILGE
jgi:phosphohistidine phosphatase